MDIDSRDHLLQQVGQTVIDRIFRSISTLICDDMLSGGILGRLESGDFAVCLPESEKAESFAWIERIRQRVEEEISPLYPEVEVTLSAGVLTSFGGGSVDENISDCMNRMAKARDFGGNKVRIS